MSKLTDALTHAKPRLLAMSSLVAAGALAPLALTPGLGAAVMVALGSLAGNVAATDVHALLSSRVLRDDVLKNHDLARAVRDAISEIIRLTATEIPDKKQKAALEKIAVIDEKHWAEAEATIWKPQTIEALATGEMIEMFSKSADEFARVEVLNLAEWHEIVRGLAAAHSFAVEGDMFSEASAFKLSTATIDLAASRLHETFPRALYEILKKDFGNGGEAYGGLLIKLVGNISAKQVETLAAAYEILDITKKTLATAERIEDKVDGLHEKIDLLQAPTLPPPSRLTINLPPHNRIFTGRRDVLDALRAELETDSRAALSGMPGVGKTQTAIEYAHEQYAAEAYAYVIYARAATETELLTDFAGAAHALNLPAKDTADINRVASAVKAWLEGADNWLLIFDNADDLRFVRSHIPANTKGHVVLTRRPDDAGGVARTIKILKMNEDDGALLLLRRAEFVKDDATLDDAEAESAAQARAISRELGGLPLSLDIAGAFIKATSTGLVEYLELYRTKGKTLRQERDPNAPYEHSVATVFALAFKQIATPDDDSEEAGVIASAAADLLRLCAFLAPAAIPLELIFAKASDLGEALQRALGDEIWRRKSIARATRYALLDANPQGHTYDMHREVQAVLRDEMDDDTQRLWTERALQSLDEAFPDASDFTQWEALDLLVPHAQACLEHADRLNIETEIVARLKNQTGFHLKSRARYEEAEPLHKQALELKKKLLGVEHPSVATSMNNLAALYRAQGRYEETEPLYKQALELRKKLLGLEHPSVAVSMNNLAGLYYAQGRYEEAELLYIQALEFWKKSFDREAPSNVATGMDNLAGLYRTQGRYEEAEPLHKQALELRKKLFGLEHPDVAISMNNLAGLYYAQGLYEEAEPLYEQALAMFEKMLGVNHPHTRIVRKNFEIFQEEKAARESEGRNVKDDAEKESD